MYKYVIVDTNLWYHRNYQTHQNLTYEVEKRTMVTGGIYGFLISIKKWKKLFNPEAEFYFLFDNPDTKTNIRSQIIDPTYKLSRKKYPSVFYRGLDFLHLLLLSYSDKFSTVYGTGYESDDIVPYILKSININEENKAILVSEDLDWSRLISDNVHQYMKGKIFDKRVFHEQYQFFPSTESVTLYKTIRGDRVDDIPVGVPRLPTKKLIKLIDDYKDIYDVLDNLEIISYLSEKWKKEIVKRKSRLTLNHKLVTFFSINESHIEDFTNKGKYQPKILKNIYETLGFDIYDLDKRLYTYIEDEKTRKAKEKGNFFRQPKIKRK